jgi:hypothetical protein
MTLLFDAFWRAAAYCLHWRVIWMSLLPVVIAGVLAGVLGYFFWEPALLFVRERLDTWSLTASVLDWLTAMGGGGLRALLAPLIVLALAVPLLVVVSLLLVAMLMMPKLVDMVAERRFPLLERRHGASIWRSVSWSFVSTVFALAALALSLPLWLIPPLVLILPPLIWGWLTYRVMAFDALAEHASPQERHAIMRDHRMPLLAIGVISGYLGAAPSVIWAFSATLLLLAPVLVVVSVWLYTLIFAFSSLWFVHYALAVLGERRKAGVDAGVGVEVLDPLERPGLVPSGVASSHAAPVPQAATPAAPPLLPPA